MNMSAIWLHVHLIVNHIPMLWTVFIFILYYYGTLKKNGDIQKASLLGFAVTAALTWVVFRSGEKASNYVPGLPLISMDYLYEHEQWAAKAVWAMYAAGAVAFLGVIKIWLRRQLHGLFFIFFSIAAFAALSLMAITADIGAKVVNAGIRPNSSLIKTPKYEQYKASRKKSGALQSDKTPVNNESTVKPAEQSSPTPAPDNTSTVVPPTQ